MFLRHLRIIGVIVLAALLPVPLQPAFSAEAARPRIALVLKSLTNEFFRSMEASATYYQSLNKDKFDLVIVGLQSETDVAQQIELTEKMIAAKVDAIVIAPADSDALVPAIKHAVDSGIEVVNIDNRLNPMALQQAKLKVVFVGPDNRSGARRVSERLLQKLKRGDQVAIIEGNPESYNGKQRSLGFTDALTQAGMTVVARKTGMWEAGQARDIAADFLKSYPDLKAILCANDSMALGAVQATEAAGKRGKILISGFDNVPPVRPLLASREVEVTAEQYGDQMAVSGIKRALSDLTGVEETPIDIVGGN